jgi:spore coat protein A
VVHLHGGHVPPQSDGYPETTLLPGQSAAYEYPNLQSPATLWYHDHALGITRLNVYMGLAGFYMIRDPAESKLNLPRGRYEIPLVIQDRSFNDDSSLEYPESWEEEFFGDAILVNGKVWPYLDVEPRKYRFRILNGSNSRTYKLALDSGQAFYQIGTDGGLLEEPVEVKQITLTAGERADVIVDFSKRRGEVHLVNSAPAPFPGDSEKAWFAKSCSLG